MLGTHWEQGRNTKNNSLHPTPKRKKQGPWWVHVEHSHWLHKSFISKTVCNHFWRGLLAGAEILVIQHSVQIPIFCFALAR
jgi:hypothetical protein